jgi:hypothetical protein
MTAKRANSPLDLCKFGFSDAPGSFYFLFGCRLTAVGTRFLLTPIIPVHRRPPRWGDIPVPWSDQEDPAEKETRKKPGGTSYSKNLGCRILVVFKGAGVDSLSRAWGRFFSLVNCQLSAVNFLLPVTPHSFHNFSQFQRPYITFCGNANPS